MKLRLLFLPLLLSLTFVSWKHEITIKQTQEVLSCLLVRTMRSSFKKDGLGNSATNLSELITQHWQAMKNCYRKDIYCQGLTLGHLN